MIARLGRGGDGKLISASPEKPVGEIMNFPVRWRTETGGMLGRQSPRTSASRAPAGPSPSLHRKWRVRARQGSAFLQDAKLHQKSAPSLVQGGKQRCSQASQEIAGHDCDGSPCSRAAVPRPRHTRRWHQDAEEVSVRDVSTQSGRAGGASRFI